MELEINNDVMPLFSSLQGPWLVRLIIVCIQLLSIIEEHNIIQLHGFVSFYIQHLILASTILPSWEEA